MFWRNVVNSEVCGQSEAYPLCGRDLTFHPPSSALDVGSCKAVMNEEYSGTVESLVLEVTGLHA